MLFGKKKPSIDSLPLEELWSVSQGSNAGNPLVVRVNTSAKAYAPHPEMPFRLGIAIPLHEPDDRGLPSAAESAQLDGIEDALVAAVNSAHLGRVVLVLTTGGMREFVSYVRSEREGHAAAERVRAATSDHQVQHYVSEDKKWTTYGQFA